ncbi:50S ribosome-binding GTPase [Lentzea atacamensis]|uniref:50S ribosome-binding GTPase n=1 Tax=Lentzea atacamensis TaxID=531938 RepID=A0A316I1L0_9PSEU|nr:dynamin family protein [Lentzea atacamensis]PWK86883.1 50S ribosome-binding GTPase [Lentzea atacamensis]
MIIDEVRRVLSLAVDAYRDQPRAAQFLRAQLDRLESPLRVAIAGRVKAGKSTLLNALVGDSLAPTDAGECTRVVTWYQDGRSPRVVMHPLSGNPVSLPVVRRDGALSVDLGGAAVSRLVVDWPAQSLRHTTLIDTPGIASLSAENSARAVRFLTPDDETPTEADAVIYLMKHLHSADASFLESFRDQGVARAAAVNTVAVISRADEIAGGRVDAMISARSIAARYRSAPELHGLAQNVVAVAGLVAMAGRTLTQAEFVALSTLAAEPRETIESSLLSADRFTSGSAERAALLRRFGVFGIRLSVTLIRQGVRSQAALADELVARSGLRELQRVLHTQFSERRELLKARSALLALDRVVRGSGGGRLAGEVERIFAGTHEFAELRLLSALRSGAVSLPRPMVAEAERLLGDSGIAPAVRLGLAPDAVAAEVRQTAFAALRRWQAHAENPMLGRKSADACRVLVRTCEGLLTRGR